MRLINVNNVHKQSLWPCVYRALDHSLDFSWYLNNVRCPQMASQGPRPQCLQGHVYVMHIWSHVSLQQNNMGS